MTFVIVILIVTASAVLVTIALTVGVRVSGTVGSRRVRAYLATVQEQLSAHVVGIRDEPPPPPRGRFEQRVMRQRLVALAPSVKGDARARLAALFETYGLVDVADRDLSDRDPLTRIRAIEALAVMGVTGAAPAIRGRLADEDPLVSLAAARALAELADVDALPDVMKALTESVAEPGEVGEILLTFGPRGVPFLEQRLRAGTPAERRLCASALGEIRALEAAPALRRTLDDPDDELVAGSARALGQIGDGTACAPLLELLTGGVRPWFVRVATARALGALDDPAAAPALASALADDNWDVRNAASAALLALDDAGLNAVTAALVELPDAGIAHFAGALDVAGRWGLVIARAPSDEALDRFVRRAAAADVRARLDELAAGDGALSHYAEQVLGLGAPA